MISDIIHIIIYLEYTMREGLVDCLYGLLLTKIRVLREHDWPLMYIMYAAAQRSLNII